MKSHRLTLSAALSCALLAACARMPEPIGTTTDESSPLEISVTASDGIATRGIITGTTLSSGSKIGLTFADVSGTKYQGVAYENIGYTASGSGSSQKWEPDSPIMVANTPGTLYGYYPYDSSITDIKKISITADSNNQTDYLYATPVSDLTKANPDAKVVMNHALAAVRLSVSRGNYTGTGKVTAASISSAGIPTSATLNARTGALSSMKGYSTAIAPAITAFTISQSASNIDILAIPSGNTTTSINVSLTIDGNEYKTIIPSAGLQQGSMTECKITVNNGEVYVTSVNVTAWRQNAAGSQIVQNDYKVSFAGNMEGLSFSNDVDENGNVTILAVPYISKDAETKPVTIAGEATLEQSVNEDTGILTIRLSDIASDVTVNFNGFYLWITAKHDVTDISTTTRLYYVSDSYVDRLKVDGVEVPVGQQYQFTSTGEHTIKLAMKKYYSAPGSIFHYIKTVTECVLPEGITELGSWGFLGCTNFKKISLPSTLKSIGYQTFERSGLESCEVPDGCRMSYGVFDECSKLTYAKLPSDMTAIPESTFQGCSSLTSLEIPQGVTSIGPGAFYGAGIEVIHIPDAVSVLETQVLKDCENLKEVKLPANLTKIGLQAFSFTPNIERFILADGTVCTEEIIIPEGVTEIAEKAFYFRNTNFKTMHLPSTLTTIKVAGLCCPNLLRFTINPANPVFDVRNNSVIETATNRLVGGAVESTVVHESVTTIASEAFYESCIASVDLHAGITMIEDYAFDYSDITQIICRATTPPTLGQSPFRLTNYNGKLKVPEASIDLYNSSPWRSTDVGYLGWTSYRWYVYALAEGE